MLIIKLIANISVSLIFPSSWFHLRTFYGSISLNLNLFLRLSNYFWEQIRHLFGPKSYQFGQMNYLVQTNVHCIFDFQKVNRLQMMFILTFLSNKIKEILKLVIYQNINDINYQAKKNYGQGGKMPNKVWSVLVSLKIFELNKHTI